MAGIHLIGSEGFVGRAIQRQTGVSNLECWSHHLPTTKNHFDLLDTSTWNDLLNHEPSCVILLAWPGLPNYQSTFHITRNLPACISLVEGLIGRGLQRLVIAGTCYEYGLQNGPLREDQLTNPHNPYAIAKDCLRRTIASLCDSNDISWRWLRIFYPFGQGQNPNSLLPSLQSAIKDGDISFPLSSGRQLRDFIPVDDVAKQLLFLTSHPSAHGVYNGGSGQAISIREFAEQNICHLRSNIKLDIGHYPDRNDEPLAFWADMNKFNSLKNL